jgi:monoterpene epsilon-lactone hydrolase
MTSLQAYFITFLLQARIKRHFRGPVDIGEFRKRLNTPLPVKVPEGWRLRTVERDGYHDEWLEPVESSQEPLPLLLYLHGGGYVACSPRTHRTLTVALAAWANMRCLSLDYPLAPEHPFPAALDTTLAVYQQLLEEGESPRRIVFAGDSAGGGLALSSMLTLRERELPLPAGAALFSPLTDLAATGASLQENDSSDALFHGSMIAQGAALYLDGRAPTDPIASPLYADLSGLPPLQVQMSDSEILRDDSVRLVEKARQDQAQVEAHLWHRLPHVWQLFPALMPEARASLKEAAAFFQRCVGASGSE